jgi:hypothetical protein
MSVQANLATYWARKLAEPWEYKRGLRRKAPLLDLQPNDLDTSLKTTFKDVNAMS